jgi:hypothetical protein
MWETEFSAYDNKGRRVEYQTRALAHHSQAERPDRVLVSGKVVHKGWVSDHRGYRIYKDYAND